MKRLQYYRHVPFGRLWSLYAAVFCLFALTGFLGDLLKLGRTPYLIVILNALCSGFVAVMYLHVGTRLQPRFFLHATLLQIPVWVGFAVLSGWLVSHYALQPVDSASGIRLASMAMLTLVVTSYSLFIRFLRGEGQEAFRLRNELELAHGIQKTLVPPVSLQTADFVVYGRSDPSEKVGGDLVDMVELEDNSTVAYLTDIAGHGLQAGILMGMVKTAARTVLLEEQSKNGAEVLSSLMDRLNRVLPAVKEPQMYATFAGFSLNADGTVHYGLAGHPAFLHYRSAESIDRLSSEQFPLGLLPVTDFSTGITKMASGDLLIVVTDGILEACDKEESEFGLERLERVVSGHAGETLPALAESILASARAFGSQVDDQTLLLVRKL
jgi:serine phosphatase RsbU (regulator of sigma subunit)